MATSPPDDVQALRAALAEAQAEAARMKAVNADLEARNAPLKLQNALMKRQLYGQRAERSAQVIDQLALSFKELEASATEEEFAAQTAARGTNVEGFVRRRPARKPFPEHLPGERVVIAAPSSCPCCGSDRLSKLGEDVTETLEVIPRAWKVVQTVRERFACRRARRSLNRRRRSILRRVGCSDRACWQ